MSNLINTNSMSMTSQEIADLVLTGEATNEQASHLALGIISLYLSGVSEMASRLDQDRDIKSAAMNRFIEYGRTIRACAAAFDGYPRCKKAFEEAISTASYAEALLVPALCLPEMRKKDGVRTYIVQNAETKLIKIGKSVNPEFRIRALETGAGSRLETLAILDEDIERRLHAEFDDLRVFGEWFNDDGRILDFIGGRHD